MYNSGVSAATSTTCCYPFTVSVKVTGEYSLRLIAYKWTLGCGRVALGYECACEP